MAGESYEGGWSRADRWGCAATAVVGLPIFGSLLLVDALGDCAPDTACRKGFLLMVLLPSLVVASATGLLVKFLVKRFAPQR